jgi:hypothetical protein
MLKLWLGGIIDADIGDSFRTHRNFLEELVNAVIAHGDYGTGLATWDVILVVSTTPPPEYVRYSRHSKETDCRLVVNHTAFLQADASHRLGLLASTVLESLLRLSKKKIPNVNFSQLQQDVLGALANVLFPIGTFDQLSDSAL